MARRVWVYSGVLLTVLLVASWMAAAMDSGKGATDGERIEERTGGEMVGEGIGNGIGGGDGGHRVVEEGEHSGVGGEGTGTEDTFRNLPDFSGEARTPRLCQVSIFEAFASSSRWGHTEGGSSQPLDKEEEAEGSGEEGRQYAKSSEDEEAEEPEMPAHRLAKR